MSALNLGVDAVNLLHDRRGIGRYAHAVLRHFCMERSADVCVTLLVPHFRLSPVRRMLANLLRCEDFTVGRRSRARKLDLDVVWYPWNGMVWIAPQPKVATIHDVWPFASPNANPRTRRSEQEPFRRSVRHARRIITDSHFSQSEIVRYLGAPMPPIDVIPLGVDAPLLPAAFAADSGPYVLFVGEAEGRKDLDTLLAAASRLEPATAKDLAVVIAGKLARRLPAALPNEVRVLALGEVSDRRLHELYAGCRAFVFPSRYEGFGLPVLEAMAQGAPVIASDAASVPEAGGDAACYYRAGDAHALAQAMHLVLQDRAYEERLRAAGRARAAAMPWSACADATLTVLQGVKQCG